MMTGTTDHPFAEGDIVEFKGTGVRFELEDINKNPHYAADGEYWAEGWGDCGTVTVDSPDEIALVMSAAAAAARTLPSLPDLVSDLVGGIIGVDGDHVRVDETDPDGNGSFLAYATATNGLRLGFRVTVSDVQPIVL